MLLEATRQDCPQSTKIGPGVPPGHAFAVVMTVMTDIEIADPRVEQYAVEHTTPEPAVVRRPWPSETRNATGAPTMMVGTLEGRLLTAAGGHAPAAQRCSRSARSPATARCRWPRRCRPTAGSSPATSARSTWPSPGGTSRPARTPTVIEIRSGPALETIATLPGPFDLVFIDADKDELLGVLRSRPAQAGTRRRDPGRQRAVERPGARPRDHRRRTPRPSRRSTTTCAPTTGSRW